MKHLVALSVAILFVAIAFVITRPSTPPPAPSDHRVVYIVRHAEKLTGQEAGQDPELSDTGFARAQRLAMILAHEQLAAVFVTDTNRSRQTGAPTCVQQDIEATQYPASDPEALLAMLDALPANSSSLVVAHSNTVSSIIEALGGEPIGDLPDDEYARFYAVMLADGIHTRTLQLTY